MAGKQGYLWIADRPFEDLASLKKYLRQSRLVKEVRFKHVVATGGAGAAVEIEEKTGTAIARLGAEAQVYIRAHTDAAGYDTKTITISWLDDAGVIHDPVTTTIDVTDSTTEVAVAGAADFYRLREMYSDVTPAAGHTLILTDADCANVDGSGGDIYGMIEESNYSSIHSRYFVPSRYLDAGSAGSKEIVSYLAYMRFFYSCVTANERATLTVTCTPYDLGRETTLTYVCPKDYLNMVWEFPFRLKAATDVTFSVADDTLTGGTFEFESIIVEGWDLFNS